MADELLYGPWADRKPGDAAALFAGYPGTWWIAGGWALEAFTGVHRDHDDLDPSVLRSEFALLRRQVAGRLHLWAAAAGALKPIRPDHHPEGAADDVLPPECGNVWTRQNALQPWEYDILLSPGDAGTWVYKRDPSITLPMSEALWQRDGINYLQPEIQLLYKAKGLRPKDQTDFDATLPYLDDHRRSWLRTALERTLADHPWIADLG